MNITSRILLLATAALFALTLAPSAAAQKVSKKFFEQSQYGFRFKPVEDFEMVPPQTRDKEMGLVAKAKGKSFSVKYEGQGVYNMEGEFELLRLIEKKQRVISDSEDGVSVTYKYKRLGLGDYVERSYSGIKGDQPSLDEEVKISKDLMARHRQWLP
ncbi:MAG: hypothetical protein KDB61_14735, partial [Planctomycetes bacterium]|nr:hypothetical protein [Planctomycetota bacterium]